MKTKTKSQCDEKPSQKLKTFFISVSQHLAHSSSNFFKEITNQLQSKNDSSFIQSLSQSNQCKSQRKKSKQNDQLSNQSELPQKLNINEEKNEVKFQGIKNMLSSIIEKQKESNNELIQNLRQKNFNSQDIKTPLINQHKYAKQKQKTGETTDQYRKQSSMQEVEQFCNTLRQQYNDKVYNKDWVAQFVYNLQQIVANNSYICVQQTFQNLKKQFYPEHNSINQERPNNNSNSRLNHLDTLEFNLQLTIKSRNSKNSFNFQPRDSLTYSNATSFGLQSTQNRSKPLNKNQNQTKFLPPNQFPSLKLMKNKDQNQTDIPHIQRAQSRGEISRQNLRQPTPNLVTKNGKSQKLFIQEEKSKGAQSQFKDSKIKLTPINKNQIHINEQHNYELIPFTQQNNHQDDQISDEIQKQIDINKSSIKKSFSINNHKNQLKLSRNTTSKKIKHNHSLFSNEISTFQTRISRIKQAKLAKKLQLQQELKRINNEIQQLKVQQVQNKKDNSISRIQSSSQKLRQNTLQSRIQINDNLQQKKQAISLVRNLKAEKVSRENQKRKKFQVLNTDLHQQIEDIMRLKYFNQQRVKQKKKLQIIERMKQQEMRKIQEQKRKQESLQFLAKLKGVQRENMARNSQLQNSEAAKAKITSKKQKLTYQKPQRQEIPQQSSKISQTKQQLINQTPILDKKKAYLSRRRNINIIKRPNEDKYEQLLG